MRRTRPWLLLAFPCVVAACAGEAEDATVDAGDDVVVPTGETAPGMADGAMAPMTVALQGIGGSTATGQATLTGAGTETQVNVQLSGLTPGEHPGHVHQGTCDAIGAVVQPLPSITATSDGSGTATGSVAIDSQTLMNGQHVISYHGTAADPAAPVACGAIAAHAM